MKTINASDLGTFLYCRRAWWYRKQGTESENQAAMAAGTRRHAHHGRQVFTARLLRFAGWLLLLAGLVALVLFLTMELAGA
ncbi:hypothetical protein KQH50_01045 [bacterium]|nr:hypothetical protein [bacterium]